VAPDILVSEDAKEIRQSVAQFANALSRVRAGTAQTQTEMRRIAKELGQGAFKTDSQLRTGLRNAISVLKNAMQNFETANPEAIKTFRERGGLSSEDRLFDVVKSKSIPSGTISKETMDKLNAIRIMPDSPEQDAALRNLSPEELATLRRIIEDESKKRQEVEAKIIKDAEELAARNYVNNAFKKGLIKKDKETSSYVLFGVQIGKDKQTVINYLINPVNSDTLHRLQKAIDLND
jgi:hypothetical protein